MPVVLTQHSYGKSRIRLTKVTRLADRHEVRELTIEIELEGDFAESYTIGDNRLIIPTDTMKNVAYALAREHPLDSIEDFGAAVAEPLPCQSFPRRSGDRPPGRAAAGANPRRWPRASSCILRQVSETRTCTVVRSRRGLRVESGLDDLFLLKSTDSAFCGFLRDRYTTLPDASDRILATMLKADWLYTAGDRRLESRRSHAFARPCSRRSRVIRVSPCSRRFMPWGRRRSSHAPRSSESPLSCPTSIASSSI